MKARFTERARKDLRDIGAYVRANSPSGAEHIRRSIVATIAFLEEFPNLGRITGKENVQVIATRGYSLLIYYRQIRPSIVILHIRHTSRDIPESELL